MMSKSEYLKALPARIKAIEEADRERAIEICHAKLVKCKSAIVYYITAAADVGESPPLEIDFGECYAPGVVDESLKDMEWKWEPNHEFHDPDVHDDAVDPVSRILLS